MDYFGILKRAWEITWRYKVLWVLGFFVMSGSGGSAPSGTSSYQFDATEGFRGVPYARELQRVTDWIAANAALLIVVAAFAALFSIVYFILGIAARGGLVHAANEAGEGRPVHLRDGWNVGFHHWGRIFMIGLVAMLPFLLVMAVLVGVFVAFAFTAFVSGGASADVASGQYGNLLAAGGTLLCCGLPLLVILLAVLGVILSIVMELAIRYGVLYDMTFGKALVQGWRDIWAKRGAVVMWLVMLLPAIAYGIVVGGILLGGLIPAVLVLRDGSVLPVAILVGVVMLVLAVPGSIYGTFVSASWTLFFRKMTGLEQPAAQPVPAYPTPGTYPSPVAYPPAPPAWTPPAPPAAPAWEGPIVPEPPAPPAPDA